MGYIVVCVNYRGSFGFGQDSIESLPGRVGTQDVKDVQAVAVRVMETHNVDASRVVAMGGSHGGFITGHLIGQYPDFYRAAALRNPAINIASMTAASDIPDWTHVESGIAYPDTQVLLGSPSMYEKAWNMSPIRYVDKVSAPVLLCIGQDDRRVPPTQAHEYRKALLARGVTVKMLSYPGNAHPIIKVDSEADCFVNMFRWFSEHSG
jgi:acylaminoacyl-peptidase